MGLCVCVYLCLCVYESLSVCVSPSKLGQCVGLCVCVCQPFKRAGRSGDMTQLQGRQSSCER